MVKGLRVIDSQDTTNQGAATTAKRKKILLESEDEIEATNCVPSVSNKSFPTPSANLSQERVSRRTRHGKDTTTLENGAAPERASVSTNSSAQASIELQPPLAVLDQCDSNTAKAEKAPTGGESVRFPLSRFRCVIR